MDLNTSIDEFTRSLLARAKAREEGLMKSGIAKTPREPHPVAQIEIKKTVRIPEKKISSSGNNDIVSSSSVEDAEEDTLLESKETYAKTDPPSDKENEEEDKFEPIPISLIKKQVYSEQLSASPVSRKTRLSALARTINEWEDDLTHTNLVGTKPPQQPQRGKHTSHGGGLISPAQNHRASSPMRFIQASSSPGMARQANSPKAPGSPTKNVSFQLNHGSSPTKQHQFGSNVAAQASPKKDLSPVKRLAPRPPASSPVKSLKQDEQEQAASTPLPTLSPVKALVGSPVKKLAPQPPVQDSVVVELERQGFKKQNMSAKKSEPEISFEQAAARFGEKTPNSSTAPPKVISSINKSTSNSSPFNMTQSSSPSRRVGKDPSELTVAQKAKLFEKGLGWEPSSSNIPKPVFKNERSGQNKNTELAIPPKSPVKTQPPPPKPMRSETHHYVKKGVIKMDEDDSMEGNEPTRVSPTKSIGAGSPKKTFYFGDEAKHNASNTSLKRSFLETKDDSSSSPKTPDNLSPSHLIAKSVKRIKVMKKDDKMYPSLTDIETETDMDRDSSFNEDDDDLHDESSSSLEFISTPKIQHCNFITPTPLAASSVQKSPADDDEISTTMAIRQIDELIDEALEGQLLDGDSTMFDNPLSSSSPILANSPTKKLTHTVSLYRKKQQQQQVVIKPMDDVLEEKDEMDEEEGENDAEAAKDFKKKLQDLEQQVSIQQNCIAQASKALNICESTFEFSNSTEYLEGERFLLLATHRRSQLLSYINKLKANQSKPKAKGPINLSTIKISSIQLYPVLSVNNKNDDYAYHMIVLLKHNGTVYSTCTIQKGHNVIEFPNDFLLKEVQPDFNVSIEVFALRSFKTVNLPHNMKYHIKNPTTPNSKSKTLFASTPSSSSKTKPSDLKSTPQSKQTFSSDSIRTSNFTLQGVLNLDLSNLNNQTWQMSMVNSFIISPNISMNVSCVNKNEIDHSGFLTIFKDVSGLGAWHRRWASIDQEYRIVFWRYPEDEQAGNKSPLEVLNLSSCMTQRVTPAPRDTCARPNTFLLVSRRAPEANDEDSLVLSVHSGYTAVKHLICADNKVERDTWIEVINRALTNLRSWGGAKY